MYVWINNKQKLIYIYIYVYIYIYIYIYLYIYRSLATFGYCHMNASSLVA